MIDHSAISQNLSNCLDDTSFLSLSGRRKGKVRDTYDLGDRLLLITTDRQSAFDRILAAIPFKGQVLNQVSAFWFEATSDVVPNHMISIPDPNVTLAKKCSVLPIEFVVRGYLTGSTDTAAWTLYNKGDRNICGNHLPDGMVKNQKFNQPILTPTTKSDEHDESISAEEIVARGIIDAATWQKLESIVFALCKRGTEIAAKNGLMLVDTKYELGIDEQGKITLIDEIHTPDSSRYWMKGTYDELFSAGKSPDILDKEFVRDWLREEKNFMGDGPIPEVDTEIKIDLCKRYMKNYEILTGLKFDLETIKEDLHPLTRIENKLKELGYLN